jgi:hypothetical protein
MKLEPKYIIPYLNYGLTCQLVQDLRDEFECEDWVEDIEIFNKGAIWIYAGYADDSLCIPLGEGDFSGFLIKQEKGTYTSVGNSIKPILRPLSDLTKEITHDTVDNYATGFGLDKETIQKFIDSGVINAAIWNFKYPIWEKMFEYHFDVFGLIDKGQAIDINTLTQSSTGEQKLRKIMSICFHKWSKLYRKAIGCFYRQKCKKCGKVRIDQ